MRFINHFWLVLVLASCRTETKPAAADPKLSATGPSELAVPSSKLPPEEFDPRLRVTDLKYNIISYASEWMVLVHFASARVEITEWEADPQFSGAEIKRGSTTTDNFVLANLAQGQWLIKVRHAMDSHALHESRKVGAWSSLEYTQGPPHHGSVLNQLIDERSQKSQAVIDLGASVLYYLRAFANDRAGCSDPAIHNMIPEEDLNDLLAMGATAIGIGMLDPRSSFSYAQGYGITSNMGQTTSNATIVDTTTQATASGTSPTVMVFTAAATALVLGVAMKALTAGIAKYLHKSATTETPAAAGVEDDKATEQAKGMNSRAKGALLVGGLVITAAVLATYFIVNQDLSPQEQAKALSATVLGLTAADSCTQARNDALAISKINEEAAALRLRVLQLQDQITALGSAANSSSSPSSSKSK